MTQQPALAGLPTDRVRVAIVGGGPSGLTAAAALAPRVDGLVLVLDREPQTGGIPRHSDHPGYGIRDLKRFISGPAYARRLTQSASAAGAQLETEAMVTGWDGPRRLVVTSPRGRRVVEADAVILATGARERPRTARRIPGDRPHGVFTTGQLQNMVHLHHAPVGKRAVVIGAELVSWSAVLTLREAGCRTVSMLTAYPKSESYTAFRIPGRIALQVPIVTHTRVVRINGRPRVTSVEVEDIDGGARRVIECDTVITTGDWIPDHELVRLAGIDLDPGTLGPRVDTALHTSEPGVFAIGNLLHPVDTADIAAIDGSHVAPFVMDHLLGRADVRDAAREVRLVADRPFRWVAPQLVTPGGPAPARGRLLLWSDEFGNLPRVTATQGGTTLATARLPWPMAPGRVFRIPFSLVAGADPAGGPVHIGLA